MQIEHISCNICQEKDQELLYKTGDKIWLIGQDFNLVRCRNCGLVFVNPRPAFQDMKEFYPAKYFSRPFGTIRITDEYWLEMKKVFENRYRPIAPYKKQGLALEIGCSDGYFLKFLQDKGWLVEGVEPSVFASDYARNVLGLNVFTGTLDDLGSKDNTFDLIYMFEVFEHLHDPNAALSKIKGMLKDDGILVITVPNFNSLLSKIFGKSWHFIDLPRHLFHFTKPTIKRMFEQAGFEILSSITVSNVCYVNPANGYSETLRFWLRDHGMYPAKVVLTESELSNLKLNLVKNKHKPIWKQILHKTEEIVYYSISRIADKVGLGENLHICARKTPK